MGYIPLADNGHIQLRRATRSDLERLLEFFRSLEPADRRYLRRDVTDPAVVDSMLREVEHGDAVRMVAIAEGRIIGLGALLFEEEAWHRHLGEIRVIVAPDFRRRHLGAALVGEMVRAARERGVAKVVAKIPGPQQRVLEMFTRLGFHLDGVLHQHVLDPEGKLVDLIVMSCPLDEVTSALRDFCRDENWLDG